MGTDEGALGRDQARDRVLAASAARWPTERFRVRDDATLTRTFGWVFTLDVVWARATGASTEPVPTPCLALVHRTTAQIVSTWRPYTPERFAGLFDCWREASQTAGTGA